MSVYIRGSDGIYKEPDTLPQRYDTTDKAYTETTGYRNSGSAWEKAWGDTDYEQAVNYVFVYDGSLNKGQSNIVNSSLYRALSYGNIVYNTNNVECYYTMSGGGAVGFAFVPNTSLSKFSMCAYKLKIITSGNSLLFVSQSSNYNSYDLNAIDLLTNDNFGQSIKWVSANVTNATTYPYPMITGQSSVRSDTDYMYVYEAVLLKQDEYAPLAEIIGYSGATEDSLINNYYAKIFSNKKAIKYMVARCTGTFMIKGLTNSTFLNALKAKELALKYYPTYWSEERIRALVVAKKLTADDYKEITGTDYVA
jgi:hypothetical protein